ncbi:MAG: hypothetical protein QXP80_00270 [Zestosphaera sp.]
MSLVLDPIYILLIAIVVFLASYMAVTYLRESSAQKKEEKGRVISLSRCLNCSYMLSGIYDKEDYVGRKSGKCPKCGGELIITAIYLEAQTQAPEK